MAWPAPDLPINYTNATVSLDTHPSSHNDTNQSLNDNYRPELIRVGNQSDQNVLDIATNAADLIEHEQRATLELGNVAITQNPGFAQVLNIAIDGLWTIRHGILTAWGAGSWGDITPFTGTQNQTWVDPPVPSSTSLLRDKMPVLSGTFAAGGGANNVPVIGLWDDSNQAINLLQQVNPIDNTFAPLNDNGFVRFQWHYPTNRADTDPLP